MLTMIGTMTPASESTRPRSTTILYSGASSSTGGIIIDPSMNSISTPLPRNSNFASA